MARSKAAFSRLDPDNKWEPLYKDDKAPTWTDDFSNILSVFGKQ